MLAAPFLAQEFLKIIPQNSELNIIPLKRRICDEAKSNICYLDYRVFRHFRR